MCPQSLFRRLRVWPVLGAFVIIATLAVASPAAAQSCASDAQCYDQGRPRTTCSGNTLVTKQSICSGSCRTVEVSRVPCPGPCAGDRCVGGPLLTSPPSRGAGGGNLPVGVCGSVCSCKSGRLTYGIGFARNARDCQRRTVDCRYGCSCDGEPRCLKRGEATN